MPQQATASESQTDGRTLATRYLKGLNDHDPGAVDGFVAIDYINHNEFVADGLEANRAWWSSFFTAFPDIEATMDEFVEHWDELNLLDLVQQIGVIPAFDFGDTEWTGTN